MLNDKLLCSLLTDHTPFCVSYEKDNKAPITQDLWVSIALDEILIPPLWMQPKGSFAGRNPTALDAALAMEQSEIPPLWMQL